MSVVFIHPPLQSTASGGNIFNQHIIQQARKNNYPLTSIPVTRDNLNAAFVTDLIRKKPRLVIWDSLFIDLLEKYPLTNPGFLSGILIHYLPSMNPSLGLASRNSLKDLETNVIRSSDCTICTGSKIRRSLSKFHPDKKFFLCRPGVEGIFRPRAKKPFKSNRAKAVELISVANLLPTKGYLDLLYALSKTKNIDWNWHIVGNEEVDTNFSKHFRSTAIALNLINKIRFYGELNAEALSVLLSKMDLFITASQYESYGMAISEAVAVGLPAVSTRVGDAADLIHHGKSGFIVSVGNSTAMHYALEALIRSPNLRNSFRRYCLNHQPASWKDCFESFKKACQLNH